MSSSSLSLCVPYPFTAQTLRPGRLRHHHPSPLVLSAQVPAAQSLPRANPHPLPFRWGSP